jgi:putative tryptophan/tyrosine transport system substrate-binding protein
LAAVDMQRRKFITLLGGAAATLGPIAAWAQEAGRKYRIGVLSFLSHEATTIVATIDELRSFGFIEGQNLVVGERGFGRRADEFSSIAMQLAESGVDAIVASGGPTIRAAQAATRTIPIIGIADDMVLEGHVRSLANHGGNTTGISIFASELDGKRLEILMELLPSARRIAILADSSVQAPAQLLALQDSWHALGVDLSIHRIVTSEGIAPALDTAKAAGVEAINVLASALLNGSRQTIFAKAIALRLPTIFQWPEGTKEGALLAYGPSQTQTFRQLGKLLGKVLRGADPGDLPVEQPTKFELAVNLKTAKAIGVEVPSSLLLRADRIIE